MTVAHAFQGILSDPAVGVYDAAAFNSLLDKRHEAPRRSIRDSEHVNESDALSHLLALQSQSAPYSPFAVLERFPLRIALTRSD